MKTLIQNVRLFDGERVHPGVSVILDDDLIAEVNPNPALTVTGAHLVDGTGRTLLPGLIDAHTHAVPGSLTQVARFGVTTELDMFSVPSTLPLTRAEAERQGAADLRSSRVGATAPGGHPAQFMGEVLGASPPSRDPGTRRTSSASGSPKAPTTSKSSSRTAPAWGPHCRHWTRPPYGRWWRRRTRRDCSRSPT
ncbi:hypothetical protein [Nonomuraea longicatena]|uniref:Amidohydrolase-related domain-containing protein n=1 Tax=Nonomuraea longicatena TaxID=83682 RepID=A0ABN1PX32_9ACTN